MEHVQNFDVHVFELRTGTWAARVEGLGERAILKQWPHGKTFRDAAEALQAAGTFASDCKNGGRSCWS